MEWLSREGRPLGVHIAEGSTELTLSKGAKSPAFGEQRDQSSMPASANYPQSSEACHITAVISLYLGSIIICSSGTGLLQWLSSKESSCQCRRVQSLSWEDPLEEERATHSSIFAWEIPWIEESGG